MMWTMGKELRKSNDVPFLQCVYSLHKNTNAGHTQVLNSDHSYILCRQQVVS